MIDLMESTDTLLLGQKVRFAVTSPPFSRKRDRDELVKNNSLCYFRRQLKAIRKRRKYTILAMAQTLGVSIPRYIKIESGHENLSLNTIVKLANLFNVAVEVSIIDFKTLCSHMMTNPTPVDQYNDEASGCERELVGLNFELERRNRLDRAGEMSDPVEKARIRMENSPVKLDPYVIGEALREEEKLLEMERESEMLWKKED